MDSTRFSEFISFFIFHCHMSKKEVLRETYYFLKCLREDSYKLMRSDLTSLFALHRTAHHGDKEAADVYLAKLKSTPQKEDNTQEETPQDLDGFKIQKIDD